MIGLLLNVTSTINYIEKARTTLKHIVPWSKEELHRDLDEDYAQLRADKSFTLDKLEKELKEVLGTHNHRDFFVKAKVIIEKNHSCHVDAYFYFKEDNRWEQLVIPFDKKIDLDEKYKEKLELSPPLEIGFTL